MAICINIYNNLRFEAYFMSGKANGFGMFKSEKKIVKGKIFFSF